MIPNSALNKREFFFLKLKIDEAHLLEVPGESFEFWGNSFEVFLELLENLCGVGSSIFLLLHFYDQVFQNLTVCLTQTNLNLFIRCRQLLGIF
jgi:hypothetical protein